MMCTKNMPHDLLLKSIISNTFQSISLNILKILITFTNIKGYKGWDFFNSRRSIKITQSSFALLYKVIFPFKKSLWTQGNKQKNCRQCSRPQPFLYKSLNACQSCSLCPTLFDRYMFTLEKKTWHSNSTKWRISN